jgi:hypothetical protein
MTLIRIEDQSTKNMIDLETARRNKELIVVSAKLTFRSTAEGGKSNPIRSGYRPNHSFEKLSDERRTTFYIGEVQFNNKELIYPGDTNVVTVIFLKAGNIEKYLTQGRRWYLYEVPRLIAEGEILQVD